jgi:hypothetical protein
VARIDAPRLDHLNITFFDQIVFDTSQLAHFITRTPNFGVPIEAHVVLHGSAGSVLFSSQTPGFGMLSVEVLCQRPDPQLWCLAQFCNSFSPPLSTVETLFIYQHEDSQSEWPDTDDIENDQWWELFRPFTTVNNLFVSELFAPRIVAAVRELGEEGITEVLPVLRNVIAIETRPVKHWRIRSARQLTNQP